MPEKPDLVVKNAAAWRTWLTSHHADPDGVWLILAKKGTTNPTSLTYDEALDEALCFGWIDGQIGKGDDTTYRRIFSPRRARSIWSKRNVEIVARLTEDGRMHAAGLAEVERARGDGRWDAAYAGSAGATVPDDLAEALAASPRATAMFDTLSSANRYAILWRVGQAKRPATRATRIATFVAMLERGETLH